MNITFQMPDEVYEKIRLIVRDELVKSTQDLSGETDMPELLTRKETARHLGVSLVTLHTWSSDTEDRNAILVPRKIGRQVRYHRADVQAALRVVRKFKRTK